MPSCNLDIFKHVLCYRNHQGYPFLPQGEEKQVNIHTVASENPLFASSGVTESVLHQSGDTDSFPVSGTTDFLVGESLRRCLRESASIHP